MAFNKSAVLISFHLWKSKRKAGFHKIAESLMGLGYHVTFVTGSASFLSYIKGDYRTPLIKTAPKNKLVKVNDKLSTFVAFNTLHPVNMRNSILNNYSSLIFRNYRDLLLPFTDLINAIGKSELIIFESFPGLLWFDSLMSINPDAKFIYRVSDDIEFQNQPPFIIQHEKEIAGKFDLVSVPSKFIFNKFRANKNTRLHFHGIDKNKFDETNMNPYSQNNNFVFTGNSYFDFNFLRTASGVYPEIKFHIIGGINREVLSDNIIYYSERNFNDTIPFVKFADAGLHTLEYSKGAESFSDSLKVMQYTYCRLPIISPGFIRSDRDNFIYYEYRNEKSIIQAIDSALHFNRESIDTSNLLSWDDLTMKLITE